MQTTDSRCCCCCIQQSTIVVVGRSTHVNYSMTSAVIQRRQATEQKIARGCCTPAAATITAKTDRVPSATNGGRTDGRAGGRSSQSAGWCTIGDRAETENFVHARDGQATPLPLGDFPIYLVPAFYSAVGEWMTRAFAQR